ncbi:MAG: dockerin type I domain-containing protein [Phycisphaerales bacterium]|nr:dockerin type I domain-containing protein [Phycisphaerales bacterium]
MNTFQMCAAIGLLSSTALGSGSDFESWDFSLSSSGEDIYWTSPTTVRTDGELYRSYFTLNSVQVDVVWNGFGIDGIDVTDQIPAEDLFEEGEAAGPPPLEFGSSSVNVPPTIAFDVFLVMNADGETIYRMSNILLGTAVVDIPIFGEQTVQLTAIYLNCSLDMEVIGSFCQADVDGSGSVDVNDLLMVIGEWGCTGTCAADITGDGTVNVQDLLELIASWGNCG